MQKNRNGGRIVAMAGSPENSAHVQRASHSIRTNNNNGNYEPDNLRWAPGSIQRLNSRTAKAIKAIEALLLESIEHHRTTPLKIARDLQGR